MRKFSLFKFISCSFVLIMVVVSCKDAELDNTDVISSHGQLTITESDINAIEYKDFALSHRSLNATKDWLKFQQLQSEIDKLKEGDTSYFQEDDQLITSFISDLKNETPEALNLPQINARLIVIETVLMKLKELSTYPQTKKPELLEAIKSVLVANSNLILQMNKKFEKESQNIIKPN